MRTALLFSLLLLAGSGRAQEVVIRDPAGLAQALRSLRPGQVLKIAPGTYPGGHFVSGVDRLTVEALDPAQASVTLQTLDPQTIALTFTATTGQSLIGTQRLARLRYTAVAGQISAFVPLHFTTLSETRLTPGQPATPLAVDGRIAVIGFQPLIEAVRSSTGARSLTLYGTPGTTNAIQQTTNLFNASAWTLRGNVTMGTNLVRTSALSSSASIRFIYYRLRQLP